MSIGLNIARRLTNTVRPKINQFFVQAFSPKYLLYTNVTISVTLSGVGDIMEQRFEIIRGVIKKWDNKRTCNMAASGVTVGIICHYWYRILDNKLPGYTLKIALKKIVLDQILFSPVCITTFFLTLAICEGASHKEFIEEIKQKAWKLYAAEWIVWPPAQLINFYFLPTKFRVLYDNTISLGYDIYTSYVRYDTPKEKKSL